MTTILTKLTGSRLFLGIIAAGALALAGVAMTAPTSASADTTGVHACVAASDLNQANMDATNVSVNFDLDGTSANLESSSAGVNIEANSAVVNLEASTATVNFELDDLSSLFCNPAR